MKLIVAVLLLFSFNVVSFAGENDNENEVNKWPSFGIGAEFFNIIENTVYRANYSYTYNDYYYRFKFDMKNTYYETTKLRISIFLNDSFKLEPVLGFYGDFRIKEYLVILGCGAYHHFREDNFSFYYGGKIVSVTTSVPWDDTNFCPVLGIAVGAEWLVHKHFSICFEPSLELLDAFAGNDLNSNGVLILRCYL